MIKIKTDAGKVHRKLNKYQSQLDGQMQNRLEIVGNFLENEMVHKIENGLSPPLKEATIARKKSSKPLFDTGELLDQISHEVRGTAVEVGVFGSRAQIAKFHEYGAPGANIPERSFMRSAFNENRKMIKKIVGWK